MNPNFVQFQKLVNNPVKFRLFLLQKLPAAFFAGLKIVSFDTDIAVIAVRQQWFNRNPFGSVYFAVLTMAAEMSTGILCMAGIYKRKPSVSMLVSKIEADFIKKATGNILFTCNDGAAIAALIEAAIASGESKTIECHSTGRNQAGETVAEITCTWSFRARH